MKNLEKIFTACVLIAGVGVVTFWIAGMKGNMELSEAALMTAGLSCWMAIIAKFIGWLRHRNCGF